MANKKKQPVGGNPTNLQIAKLFRSVASALMLSPGDNRFRVISYEKAADSIEHASSEVRDLWDEGKLGSLSGVGPAMTGHLDELFKTGRVKHFDQILAGFPKAMFELLDIPGIGPKTAFKLCQVLGISKSHNAVEKLEKAAQKGKIRNIEGFGAESEKSILESISQWKNRSNRILLPQASQIAYQIIDWLKNLEEITQIEPLGSLRRDASTIGDIDIAVASNNPEAVIKRFTDYPQKSRVIEAGSSTASIGLPNGIQVDLMVQPPRSFGALLQHFTGSKHHNIALREYALKQGLSLSEKGVRKNGKLQEFSNEKAFYQHLNLDWIPPELREDNGEITAAKNHSLPRLVEIQDIKGDLHLHSDFNIEPSHDLGTSSMVDYVELAKKMGYAYIGFTEHNPSSSRHEKAQIIELVKLKKETVEKLIYSNYGRGINILNGMEIDIRPDGSLALPDEAFDYLDYAIASIHGSFKGSKSSQTERVLKALSHPKVRIFGHPTARKINEREGVDLDWDTIFDFCLSHQIILEINSSPDRLDLPDVLVRDAVKAGVKLVINTDSHQVQSMQIMSYGVSVARRGWATKSSIINSLPWREFKITLLG